MFPIFGLVFLGFLAVRFAMIGEGGVRGLVLFVFNFAIPALLFQSLAELELPDDIEWGFLGAYYAGSFLAYALGMGVARFGFGKGISDQAMYGMSGSYSNLVMTGLPIVLMALGEDALLPMMLIIAFQSITFMPITVVLIQKGRTTNGSAARQLAEIALELLKNPIITSILLGLAANGLGIGIGSGLGGLLELLGAAAIPCALFALGGSLAGYSLRGDLKPTVVLTVLKLAVQPLVVWAIAVPLLGLSGIAVSVAIVLAAMPSAVNSYLFAARYDVSADVAAKTVLLTTMGSAVTITAVLALLGV